MAKPFGESRALPEVLDVNVEKIRSSAFRPRSGLDETKLAALSRSIRRLGLIHAVLLRPSESGFEIVVGGRRVQAARRAGISSLPAVIRNMSDREVLETILTENIQREEMTDVDRGRICRILKDKFPDEYPDNSTIANKLGYSEAEVKTWVSLVEEAPREVQQLVAAPVQGPRGLGVPKGKISSDVAIGIIRKIKEPSRQIQVAKKLAERPVPVRMARQIIREVAKRPERPLERIIGKVVDTPSAIPFSKHHAELISKGIKTQTSRKGIDPRWKAGAIVPAAITQFADLRIVDVARKKLADFTDEDAAREGGYTLNEFKKVWIGLHSEWNPNETVTVIRFRVHRLV